MTASGTFEKFAGRLVKVRLQFHCRRSGTNGGLPPDSRPGIAKSLALSAFFITLSTAAPACG
jgi:hypothetical protein